MRHLPIPDGAGPDVITSQCLKPGWSGYRERWLAAAAIYRDAGGNPWKVFPAEFSETEKGVLSKLYDSRRSGGPITRIRQQEGGFLSCPMCGSFGGRSLDHALPRTTYPEFSIVRENLVPACTICNSDEKGSEFRGAVLHERMIHPYYDTWASAPIWQVEFGDDLDAVVFRAVPSSGMKEEQVSTVKYHLSIVLGRAWKVNCRNYWGTLPQKIRMRLGADIALGSIKAELETRLTEEIYDAGVNGWHPAFLRGLLDDARIPMHLADRIGKLPVG